MARLREQPRVFVASAVGLIALIAVGLLIGLALGGDDGDERVPSEAQTQRAARAEAALRATGARLQAAERRATRSAARARRLERRAARLRRELAQARRRARR